MKEYKKNSHWLNEALNNNDLETPLLVGDTKADICIIGGGFTGLWTAIHLKEDDPSLDLSLIHI